MTGFLIGATLVLLCVLAQLLLPLLKPRLALPAGESPALAILREQRRELAADLAAGRMDAATHAESMSELELRAAIEMAPLEASATTAPARVWAVGLGLGLPVAALALYLLIGQPAGLDPVNTQPAQQFGAQDIEAMVSKLAAKVEANPDDLQGAQMLGRSYMVLEKFAEAARVFEQLAQRKPDDAQIYADWADALGSVPGQTLAGEPSKLIARALQLDPDNVKALALAGTVAFDAQDYKGALRHWERMASKVDPQSEIGKNAESMIAEARSRAGLPAAKAAASATPAGGGLAISGRITLDPALRSKLGAEDVLFVFARSSAGGPPVAALRLRAADLPLSFDFAAAAMMGVPGEGPFTVTARISKSGQPGAKPGDLEGVSAALPINTKDIEIKIIKIVE
jgi:cytochrome c-type biogenesis protein CcmH